GKIRFIQLRDGSGVIQCVVLADRVTPEVFELADHIPYESSVIITGEVRKDPRSPIGYEITVDNIELISEAEPYPISNKDHGVAFVEVIETGRSHEDTLCLDPIGPHLL
ncbi:MAG: OB-fold nucleic acid binding domain-containing protein, partial [Deltaproteobacteria bacterium]|nr:OB-fold nucleic acid binding domain-containing protein [Deltaproteobacteria bacterium]